MLCHAYSPPCLLSHTDKWEDCFWRVSSDVLQLRGAAGVWELLWQSCFLSTLDVTRAGWCGNLHFFSMNSYFNCSRTEYGKTSQILFFFLVLEQSEQVNSTFTLTLPFQDWVSAPYWDSNFQSFPIARSTFPKLFASQLFCMLIWCLGVGGDLQLFTWDPCCACEEQSSQPKMIRC